MIEFFFFTQTAISLYVIIILIASAFIIFGE